MPNTPRARGERTYAGIDLSERREQRRKRFLDAGLEVFGSVGYRQATVRALCKQARLTDRYFYESFESMEDLLVAVYQREFDRLRQALIPVLGLTIRSDDPLQGIRAGLALVFAMAEDDRVARVCWLEVLGVSARVNQVYSECIDQFGQLLILATQAHMREWQPTPVHARLLGQAMIGVISQIVTQGLLRVAHMERSTKAERIAAATLVFEGVFDHIRLTSGALSPARMPPASARPPP